MKLNTRKKILLGSSVALVLLSAGLSTQLRTYDFQVIPARPCIAYVHGRTVHFESHTAVVRATKDKRHIDLLTLWGWREVPIMTPVN